MDHNDVGRVCMLVSRAQGREFTPEDLDIWADAIGDLNGDLAIAAVKALIRDSSDFIVPARVRTKYQTLASTRLANANQPQAPDGMSDVEYRTWLRAWRHAVIAGASDHDAERAALGAIGRRLPDPVQIEQAPRLVLEGIVLTDEDE